MYTLDTMQNKCNGVESTIFSSEMWRSRNIKKHKMEVHIQLL